MSPQRNSTWGQVPARVLLWLAAVIALANAAPSYYWAFGGEALLDTVGQWLIEFRAAMPIMAGLGLFTIAVGKTAAALIPLMLLARPAPSSTVWYTLSWFIAGALLVYGTLGLVINSALLLWPGVSLQDPTARLGQALLWYPMLLMWGVVLAGGLWALRSRRGADHLSTTHTIG